MAPILIPDSSVRDLATRLAALSLTLALASCNGGGLGLPFRGWSGPPAALGLGTPPPAIGACGTTLDAFTVRIEDASGNLVADATNVVTLSLAGGSSSFSGTLVQTPVGGIATFGDLSYSVAETITFDLTSPALDPVLATSMTLEVGAPAQLAFAAAPELQQQHGAVFSFFVVEVQDACGNRVTTDGSTQVDVTLQSGLGTLGGTLSRTVQGGIAVFDDVTYDTVETMVLQAASTPATTVLSAGVIDVQSGPATGGALARADLDSLGAESDGDSDNPAVSADGRFVAFESDATNLVVADSNAAKDVFVRDLMTGVVTRVSVDSFGNEGDGDSLRPSISAGGRFVAFESSATNLVAGDTNGAKDVFVHDRATGATTRVSIDAAGAEGNGDSSAASISAAGRCVAYGSLATNLVPGDSNVASDVFVLDRATGTVERASVDSLGGQSDGDSTQPSISGDGRFVAFQSAATNLVSGDTNTVEDVFVHDRTTAATVRVSVDSLGDEGNGASRVPSISVDGSVVAFESNADDLVAADTNNRMDVFVHDRSTAATIRASVDNASVEGDRESSLAALSGDGERVLFQGRARNLVYDDTNNRWDIFVHTRSTGRTVRLSMGTDGSQANGHCRALALSADGLHVAFDSSADNLVAADLNGARDIFFRSIVGEPTLGSLAPANGPASGGTSVTVSGTGFQSGSPGANRIWFDGTPATNVTIVDDPTITCDVPPGPAGTAVDVVLTNNNGESVRAGGYAYDP